jgi:hypothetical protein
LPSRSNRRTDQSRRTGQARRTASDRRTEDERRADEGRAGTGPEIEQDSRKGEERRSDSDRRGIENRRSGDRRETANRRSGDKRRTESERRSGPDRRIRQTEIDHDDHRKPQERREKQRRGEREEVVPITDWEPPEEEGKRVQEKRSFILIAGVVGIAALLPAIFVSLYLTNVTVKPKPVPETPSPGIVSPGGDIPEQEPANIPVESLVETESEPPEPGKVRTLSQDILKISPHIYSHVKLTLLSGTTIDETGQSHRDLSTMSVETIEISIKSAHWDSLDSNQKVHLLHQTFRLLNAKYPDVTKFIELGFDDERKDLRFRFDELSIQKNPRG